MPGYRFFFFALDRGEPIHIHVERDNSYAKYWLQSNWQRAKDLVLKKWLQYGLYLRNIRKFLLRGGMNSSPNRRPIYEPLGEDVSFTDTALVVILSDGREIRMPLEWSERLRKASAKQKKMAPHRRRCWYPLGRH
jgi:hypothetical protein